MEARAGSTRAIASTPVRGVPLFGVRTTLMHKLTIAALAFGTGIAVAKAAGAPAALLGSTSLTWEQIESGTGKGFGKPIFRTPTATLDELEMHVTHLPPGKEP